jgi:quercetin dioxygenase-like cupin family protein
LVMSENCLKFNVGMRAIFTFIFIIVISSGYAQSVGPKPVTPDSIKWVSTPAIPGLLSAWLVGAQDTPGLYILRVKLGAGTIIPPHTHPDERSTTVLAGTIYVGFGDTFDKSKAKAVTVGSVYVVPAKVPHYIWAKDGDAMYQESGNGPTANKFIKSS